MSQPCSFIYLLCTRVILYIFSLEFWLAKTCCILLTKRMWPHFQTCFQGCWLRMPSKHQIHWFYPFFQRVRIDCLFAFHARSRTECDMFLQPWLWYWSHSRPLCTNSLSAFRAPVTALNNNSFKCWGAGSTNIIRCRQQPPPVDWKT